MELISMTDFVLEQLEIKQSTSEFKEVVKNYVKFLKQPLTVGMFIPIHEDGEVIPNPENVFDHEGIVSRMYEDAMKNVLFVGDWMYSDVLSEIKAYKPIYFSWDVRYPKTIEDVANETSGAYRRQLTLTENAIKQIGL